MSPEKRRPEVPGLFTWPSDDPQLIGARCETCLTVFFPSFAEHHRPGCAGGPVEQRLLSRSGTLVSYTVQHYCPPPPYPPPDPFEPMVLGTVALPDGVQVPGRIIGSSVEELAIGSEMELVVDTLYVDDEGFEALTWMFRVLSEPNGGDSR